MRGRCGKVTRLQKLDETTGDGEIQMDVSAFQCKSLGRDQWKEGIQYVAPRWRAASELLHIGQDGVVK